MPHGMIIVGCDGCVGGIYFQPLHDLIIGSCYCRSSL